MKNSIMLVGIFLIIALAGTFLFVTASKEPTSSNVLNEPNAASQHITLSIKEYNYYPQVIRVKAGQPVTITLDKSVVGCLRSFTIPEFGVSQYSADPTQTIEFTPTKKGTFAFACSMGMGTGTLIVE